MKVKERVAALEDESIRLEDYIQELEDRLNELDDLIDAILGEDEDDEFDSEDE